MSSPEPAVVDGPMSSNLLAALAFEAPYVVQRLVKDRVVDTRAEGEQLLSEVIRYLVLCESNPDVTIGMYSVRVDEAWHTFILYAAQYIDFGMRFFGRYVRHAPTDGPKSPAVGSNCAVNRPELSFADFRREYETLYNEPLPDVWYDGRSIGLTRRIFNHSAGAVTAVQGDLEARLIDETGHVILSANNVVFGALEFIAQTGAFYVRELPGELTEDEKVTLVRSLESVGALRVAP